MRHTHSPLIHERPARQTTVSQAHTAFRDLPDEERRRRLVEAIHRELGHAPARQPALLTEVEVARVLKRTVGTLRNRRWAGLPVPRHVVVGRMVLYEPLDVVDFMLSRA
ncbi:MAG: hypothetical protein Q8O14_13975 [bacterium]|nr:hypothetical protein [bacterium]